MRKLLCFFVLLILIMAAPAYALAATLSLSPSSGAFNKTCSFALEVKLDTTGVETDGTDAIIFYDQGKLTATSILSGSIYADYPGNNIDDATGQVTVSGLASVSSGFKGMGTLATINFTVKEAAAAGATKISFDFDASNKGKTTDSNVVERGTVVDVLGSVVNGNYTIGSGSCSGGTVVSPGGGGQGTATPSGQAQAPVKEVPVKVLPPAGSEQFTYALAIVGSVLTILGILGLALL